VRSPISGVDLIAMLSVQAHSDDLYANATSLLQQQTGTHWWAYISAENASRPFPWWLTWAPSAAEAALMAELEQHVSAPFVAADPGRASRVIWVLPRRAVALRAAVVATSARALEPHALFGEAQSQRPLKGRDLDQTNSHWLLSPSRLRSRWCRPLALLAPKRQPGAGIADQWLRVLDARARQRHAGRLDAGRVPAVGRPRIDDKPPADDAPRR